MNIQYLYFLQVAESLNMSKVAQRNNVTHQCISAHINSLEKKLGVKLFNRAPSLSLTEEGTIFYEGLYELKMNEDKLITKVKKLSKKNSNKLKLGVPSSYYNMIVPKILTAFKSQYKYVNLVIEGNYSSLLEQATVNNEIDLFIGTGRSTSIKLESILLMQETLYLVLSKDIPFKQNIPIEQYLSDIPLILPPRPSRLRSAIEAFANKHECTLNVILESNHLDMYCELCSNHSWGCVLSEMFIKQYIINHNSNNLIFIRFRGVEKEDGNIYLSFQPGDLSAHQKSLISLIKKYFQDWRYKHATFLSDEGQDIMPM